MMRLFHPVVGLPGDGLDRLGRIGLAFLALATIGLTMGALFPTDPASTAPEAMSSSGRMHAVSFMIGLPSEIISVLLVTLALRKESPWPALLVALAATVWISLGVLVVALVLAVHRPGEAPLGFFAIPNRTFMSAFAAWLIVAARSSGYDPMPGRPRRL
jgi:hypothetical protein